MSYKQPDGFLSYVKEWEEKIGAFIELSGEKGAPVSQSPPSGEKPEDGGALPRPGCPEKAAALIRDLPFAVKDNIAVAGFSLSCGSKLLAGFRSPYTATAVRALWAAGAELIGKTNLDEFGMGSSTDNSGIKKTNNPWDLSRVPGGSSGGSAAAVAAGIVPFALGSDTGGSVRQPAAFCGVVGLKPTYGAVSRYGLVAYASSLEGIGVLADSAARARAVFAAIRGRDPLDDTSRDPPAGAPPLYAPADKTTPASTGGDPPALSGFSIGVLSPEAVARAVAQTAASGMNAGGKTGALEIAAQAAELESEVRRGFELAKERFASMGCSLVDVEIPSLKYGVPAYYTIAAAEASANLARFDGVRYGRRPPMAENPGELVDKTREAGFGDEVKLRILLGTFVLRSGFQDRYYLRAQRIRAGIKANFEALLGGGYTGEGDAGGAKNAAAPEKDSRAPRVDAILLPVFPSRAFGRGPSSLSAFAQKAADLYTCCANLAGLPAISFPASLEGGLPVGVQLLGRAFSEAKLLDLVEAYEGAYPFPHPQGYRAFWN
ncbi:MAG: Asp-tRNA(Asn)/Glu-tRNA(Gln) amidotransferase subunit GatA [Spirochaetaceae bacterium]|jgi:aspartyl-tRNA(Asn)/glutamyl-tRNA(Gln) amidotransferase subunit A|nr:Asp-tRNA(Asn)/Glu-tRNA(Gln) amidotransferase subunit GatA [Spirochaetaceae bacterium]